MDGSEERGGRKREGDMRERGGRVEGGSAEDEVKGRDELSRGEGGEERQEAHDDEKVGNT